MHGGDKMAPDVDGGVLVRLELGGAAATFNLEKAVCSHGLFMMAPNHWDPQSKTLQRPLRLGLDDRETSFIVRVSHPSMCPQELHIRVLGARSLCLQQRHSLLVGTFSLSFCRFCSKFKWSSLLVWSDNCHWHIDVAVGENNYALCLKIQFFLNCCNLSICEFLLVYGFVFVCVCVLWRIVCLFFSLARTNQMTRIIELSREYFHFYYVTCTFLYLCPRVTTLMSCWFCRDK